jgi:hypothetical protein
MQPPLRPEDFDLDTLLAAQYERKTDTCGGSFHHYPVQVDRSNPPVKEPTLFLFSER